MDMTVSKTKTNSVGDDTPFVHTTKLDTLWFQVGGTLCNLRCHHCFISCSPENDKFGFLSLETCEQNLRESVPLGVKEFYFTGGEPFANPEMCDILEKALEYGAATVLTNATILRDKTLDRLEAMNEGSTHSLELRVSLDGYTAEMNDPIRGDGTFDKAMEGVRELVKRGFSPILTITRTWSGDDNVVLAGFRQMLGGIGYEEPRLKILPVLKMGAEVERTEGYGEEARLTTAMMAEYDQSQLVCSSARLVTDKGIWVCPILLDAPDARVSDTLSQAIGDFPLNHQACYTCWQFGAICSNASTGAAGITKNNCCGKG